MFYLILFIVLLLVATLLYSKYRHTDVLRLGKPRKSKGENTDVLNVDGVPAQEEEVTVNIDDFLEEYIVGDSIPEEVLMALQLKRLAGEETARVSMKILTEARTRCSAYWKKESAREACLVLDEKAKALEEDGQLQRAMIYYERNVESGLPIYHSYDRLIAIYREQGETEKEVEVLRKALRAFGEHHAVLKEICLLKLERAEKALREKY